MNDAMLGVQIQTPRLVTYASKNFLMNFALIAITHSEYKHATNLTCLIPLFQFLYTAKKDIFRMLKAISSFIYLCTLIYVASNLDFFFLITQVFLKLLLCLI